uniref:Uncharacterized protein n=1 Tax=uncultured prokaryote TaxID=198431 RepID=A0A0H5Q5W6_9ZZZZ|nr:hypothetical protein [uncultured prokaryote]
MSHIAANVILPHVSGVPRDVTVNTFHFDGDPGGGDTAQIASNLISFYNDVVLTNRVAYFLSTIVSRATNGCRIEQYDMTDPEPRVPIATTVFTLGAAGATASFPSEVALCTSFYAAPASGSPQARRRGRIFLGPLGYIGGDTTTSVPNRPVSATRATIVASTQQLQEDSVASSTPWCVYSRVDNVIRPIVGGWVDNEYDTQRRRQPGVTIRDAWSASV